MTKQKTFSKALQLVFSLVCLIALTTTSVNAGWIYSYSNSGSSGNSSQVTINGSTIQQNQNVTQSNTNSNTQNNSSGSYTGGYKKEKLPDFPSCKYPKGDKVAYYREGWHWIVGNSVLQWGKDSVYALRNDNYLQCFCPKKTNEADYTPDYKYGVQTNWLKANNISTQKQEELKTQGWIWVANGTDFGLASEPYLAKNLGYQCKTPWSKYHI